MDSLYRKGVLVVLVVVMLGVSLIAMAAPVSGKIKSVDAEKSSITVTVGEEDKAYTVNDGAKISIDGKDGKLADLKAGMNVKLTLNDDGKATAIEAKCAE
jgi:biopolymer transport protein ExbD